MRSPCAYYNHGAVRLKEGILSRNFDFLWWEMVNPDAGLQNTVFFFFVNDWFAGVFKWISCKFFLFLPEKNYVRPFLLSNLAPFLPNLAPFLSNFVPFLAKYLVQSRTFFSFSFLCILLKSLKYEFKKKNRISKIFETWF